jgi:hypothetical protein
MTETINAQFLKQVVGAMVDVDMSSMLPKIIGREVCL